MSQHPPPHVWDAWPGWSTITANERSSFTLWFTGLPGTGKTTLLQTLNYRMRLYNQSLRKQLGDRIFGDGFVADEAVHFGEEVSDGVLVVED